MPTPQTLYPKEQIALKDVDHIANKWAFIGIDLAPHETLETGVSAFDREGKLTRMDKLNTEDEILRFIDGVAPAPNVIVAIDIPKSLEIDGKWRQQEIKMHPLRLIRPTDGKTTDRYASRAWRLYDTLTEKGILTLAYFNYLAKMRYGANIPFRTRTPQGCRALQATIKHVFNVEDMPTNLAPVSVLDSIVGSYAAWSLFVGEDGKDFQLYKDPKDRLFLDPLQKPDYKKPAPKRRRYHRYRKS